jgi:hypothetical protein
MYADIYYDSNDTSYYIDPNSTSNTALRMRGGALFGPNTTWGRSLGIGTNGHAGASFGSVAVTDGNLHIDAASGFDMYMNFYAGNNLYYAHGSSIRGGFYTDSSVRAALFYDINDTAFFSDPNGTRSRFRRLTLANSLLGLEGSGNAGDGFPYARIVEAWGISFQPQDARWAPNVLGASFLVGFISNGANYGNGNILATGNITAFFSDERLKTKQGKIENALEKVCSLDGFIYTNNDLAKSFGYTDEKTQIGLSAQQVQKIAPEIVTLAPFDMTGDGKRDGNGKIHSKSGENYLTMDYARLVPVLVEAIKEQQEIIEKMNKRLEYLENLNPDA